jgi:clan AA aspartic protease
MQIDGYFNTRNDPVINLDVGSSKVEFLIDTGFSGGLIIPNELAISLEINYDRGLEEFSSVTGATFYASGCFMTIVWFGRAIRVPVATSGEVNEAILGGRMLKDCRLTVDYVNRTVTIMQIRAFLR